MSHYDHIYISPHLDDVALSCGGSISQQTAAGKMTLVVTVFAGGPEPAASFSPFARQLHTRWGTPTDAAATRRQEDLAALKVLGAIGEHWTYADCIYRQTASGEFPYDSEESLWGSIHPSEENLVDELATRLSALPLAQGGTMCVPLGVGDHVDHQIVHKAATLCGRSIAFYEDFPYARDPETVYSRLTSGHWESHLVRISEEALRAKIAAIACYSSQLSTFWANLKEMTADIRETALRVGAGEAAERYWRRAG